MSTSTPSDVGIGRSKVPRLLTRALPSRLLYTQMLNVFVLSASRRQNAEVIICMMVTRDHALRLEGHHPEE